MSTVSTARSRKRAQDSSRDIVVVNLDTISPTVGTGSQREVLIRMGTRTSPIDVEALDDRKRKARRRSVVVVDQEEDTTQQGRYDAGTIFPRLSGSRRRRVPPVICLSPDREGDTFQSNNASRISRICTRVAPTEPIFTCPVCLNNLDKPSTTICGHIFCEKCIEASLKAQKKCPTCRKSLAMKDFHRVYLPASAD